MVGQAVWNQKDLDPKKIHAFRDNGDGYCTLCNRHRGPVRHMTESAKARIQATQTQKPATRTRGPAPFDCADVASKLRTAASLIMGAAVRGPDAVRRDLGPAKRILKQVCKDLGILGVNRG